MADRNNKAIMVAVFVTAFLDLVGFSIIFPLFPQLLDHYLALEGPDSAIGHLVAQLTTWAGDGEDAKFAVVVLFGGVLGSVYSVLQFLFAPLWGAISDRHGRRPTLLLTLVGTCLSYFAWFFAGSFAILVAARLLGGIMAGNISTASAVIADVTEPNERSKGMALIGVAFGLGFVIGPAFGGAASFVDLTQVFEGSAAWGVNPFSAAAAIAGALSIVNIALVAARLPETHPVEKRGRGQQHRTANPLKMFGVGRFGRNVHRANLISFFYLTAFSAMEFTLVFLTVDRFEFSPRHNAAMFVFIGFVIAAVQGGGVRRLAPRFGDRKLVRFGLMAIVPGLVVVGFARSVPMLFVGLGLMAAGSAFATPCLSALVSRYAPIDEQGLAMGLFRSMGALSRAVGPILGGLLYWKLGGESPYIAAAVLLTLPIGLSLGLPPPP